MGAMKNKAIQEREESLLSPLFVPHFYEVNDVQYEEQQVVQRTIQEEIEEEKFIREFVKDNRALVLKQATEYVKQKLIYKNKNKCVE
tara:strand:+ start:360 stop:620 length:261 start_codon:yes stop_codon:yes gene_type:complete